ncbi:hypothetical protein ACLB2K_063409 [Fragaria x ananassa]
MRTRSTMSPQKLRRRCPMVVMFDVVLRSPPDLSQNADEGSTTWTKSNKLGLSSSLVNSLLVNSIVKLSTVNWECIGDSEKKKLIDGLTLYFTIDFGNKQMWDEWDWLYWHFDSPDFKTRSAANTTNRGKKESEHHTGRLPIIYRVIHHKEKGEEFPIIPAYTETYDTVNNPKAVKNLEEMQKEASQLKNAQKNANPNIPEAELPPLEWSMNIKVLEAGVRRRAGKEIYGLGRAGVR